MLILILSKLSEDFLAYGLMQVRHIIFNLANPYKQWEWGPFIQRFRFQSTILRMFLFMSYTTGFLCRRYCILKMGIKLIQAFKARTLIFFKQAAHDSHVTFEIRRFEMLLLGNLILEYFLSALEKRCHYLQHSPFSGRKYPNSYCLVLKNIEGTKQNSFLEP